MSQVAYANQLNEVIPQGLCRLKRSLHVQMLGSQGKEINILHFLNRGKMKHGGFNELIHRWFKTKTKPRKWAQRSGISLSRARSLRVQEKEPGEIHPAA